MISGIQRIEDDCIFLNSSQVIYISKGSRGSGLRVRTPTELFFAADDEEARATARAYNRDRVKGKALPLPIYWYWMKTYRIA